MHVSFSIRKIHGILLILKMDTKEYVKLFDAIEELDEDDIIDIVALPPDKVDSVTDEEDNNMVIADNILNDNIIGDIAGRIEIYTPNDCPESVARDKRLLWKKPLVNRVPSPGENETNKSIQDMHQGLYCNLLLQFISNIGSFETFKPFFDDNIILLIVKQTNLYARQNNNHQFHVTVEEIKNFIGILLLSSYHTLPRQKM